LYIVSLSADGKLTVRATATQGDFYFDKADLSATGCNNTSVPDPTATLLLGFGLMGVA